MFSNCVHWVAIAATVSLSFSQPAMAQGMSDDLRDRLEEMTDVMADIADVAAPGTDLAGTVLDTVGSDGAALVDYVGGSIAYVPYTGVLRGADGTLRSGYGNSYDQSLALITLLRRAGYEAQILVGPETEGAFATTRAAMPSPINQDDMQDLLGELEELTEDLVAEGVVQAPPAIPAPDGQTFDPAVGADAAAAAVALLTPTEAAAPAEDPATYALVRYRQGPADDWAYADPAKNTVLTELDTEPYAKLSNQVPDEHLHYVELRVVVESGAFGSVPVAETRAPASNLTDQPLSFGLVPTGVLFAQDIAFLDPSQSIAFVSNYGPDATISLDGQVFAMDIAQTAQAGVFQTGASLLSDAAASLAAEEKVASALLDRIVLEVRTSGPDGSYDNAARRILLDRQLVENRLEMQNDGLSLESGLLAAATGSNLLSVGFGAPSSAEQSGKQLAYLAEILSALLDDPANPDVAELASSLQSEMLHSAIAGLLTDADDFIHTTPSVVALRTVGSGPDDSAEVRIAVLTDVMIDGRFAKAPEAAFENAIRTAAFEDVIVHSVAEALAYSDDLHGSYMALQSAIGAGTAPILLDEYLAGNPTANTPEEAIQLSFLSDLVAQEKEAVVWPSASVHDTVWLEFDAVRGSARLASGLGEGNTTEYLTLVTAVGLFFAVAAGVAGWLSCAGKSGQSLGSCFSCHGVAAAAGIGGALAGAAAGSGWTATPAGQGAVMGGVLTFGFASVIQAVVCA